MPQELSLPAWDARYPDPERLRHEVSSMVDSFVQTLLDAIPNDHIRAIYLKGSSKKRWDTPIDYVPEASDIDIHLWLHDDEKRIRPSITLAQAAAIQRGGEAGYYAACPQPIHTPRIQLLDMNRLMDMPGYMHSPRSTVEVLIGEEYPIADYTCLDDLERAKCTDLIDNASVLPKLPYRVIDRPGKHLAEVMRDLGYRVSPAAPIVLQLDGIGVETAWSMNRTQAVGALSRIRRSDLAAAYVRYYIARWNWFTSGYMDFDEARAAVFSAAEVIQRAETIANTHLDRRGLRTSQPLDNE